MGWFTKDPEHERRKALAALHLHFDQVGFNGAEVCVTEWIAAVGPTAASKVNLHRVTLEGRAAVLAKLYLLYRTATKATSEQALQILKQMAEHH